MAAKKTTPKKVKITNLEKLDKLIALAIKGQHKTAEAKKFYAALRTALKPRIKGDLIKEILDLHIEGYSNKEIIERGYNKSTVSRQVKEFTTRSTFATVYAVGDDTDSES